MDRTEAKMGKVFLDRMDKEEMESMDKMVVALMEFLVKMAAAKMVQIMVYKTIMFSFRAKNCLTVS